MKTAHALDNLRKKISLARVRYTPIYELENIYLDGIKEIYRNDEKQFNKALTLFQLEPYPLLDTIEALRFLAGIEAYKKMYFAAWASNLDENDFKTPFSQLERRLGYYAQHQMNEREIILPK